MSIETQLHDEIKYEIEELRQMKIGSEEHRAAVDVLTKLMDRSIDLYRIETENTEKEKARESEELLKKKQLADEKKDRMVKNIISVGGIVLPILVTIWGTKVSLKFEEEGTFTTIMGRGFVNKLLPKK